MKLKVQLTLTTSQGMDYSSQNFKLILSLRERPETVFEIPFTLKKEIKASKRYPINKHLTVDGQGFTFMNLLFLRSDLN